MSATRLDAADPVRVINRLRRELASARMRYANLVAAARATLAAAGDGDPHALEFLADELIVQHGQIDLDDMPALPALADDESWWQR